MGGVCVHSMNDICTKKQVWDPIILYTRVLEQLALPTDGKRPQ